MNPTVTAESSKVENSKVEAAISCFFGDLKRLRRNIDFLSVVELQNSQSFGDFYRSMSWAQPCYVSNAVAHMQAMHMHFQGFDDADGILYH